MRKHRTEEAMAVNDKVVLVTGGARGMGREYVRGFLREGAKVIATDLSWAPSGFSSDDTPFLDEIRGNQNVLAEVMDITVDSHVRRVYAAAMERFGTVDVIINNAGMRQRDLYPPHGSVTTLETEVGDWQRLFDTHVFGTLRVVKQFVQPMLEKRRGSIISVASNGYNASRPDGREMPYQSAKAALVTMTLYLGRELKPHNIAANVILPGHTRSTGSDEQEKLRGEQRARAAAPGASVFRPLRVNPDHVVPLALFLAEQGAEGVTEQVISALPWNEEHGFGGVERWGYAEDLSAADIRRPAGAPR
jgi:NAD(P)-dependent dehydrogenase (short-subunit alcohol dehydrogenase family)